MFERSKKAASNLKRLIAVAAVPALSVLAISLSPHPSNADAHALYVVSDESYLRVDEVAGDVFLTDGSASLVSRQGGSELALASGRTVTVTHQDLTFSTVSRQETVTELLARLDVRPSPLEMVSVAILDNGIEIIVNSEFVFYEHITNTTEHETVYQYNDKLPDWQENVLQEGRDGERREVYEVIYQDGEETARQLIDVVDTPAEPTIIEKGTRANFANNGDEVSAINTNADGSGTITLQRPGPHLQRGPDHEGHRLHRRRQRGHPHRLRHPGPRRRGGGGQERDAPGHQGLCGLQRRQLCLWLCGGGGHRRAGQHHRPLYGYQPGVHPVRRAGVYRIHSGLTPGIRRQLRQDQERPPAPGGRSFYPHRFFVV